MKVQRDKLHQYQKRITVITTRETEIAKEHLRKGDKARAQLALRRKKYQVSLLAKTDQQLAQLENLVTDVEFALVQKDVLFGLQQGTAVLKEIRKEMGGIENVEKLLGESEEEKQYQQELSELLNGKMTNQEEDEVEEELERLESEALPKVPVTQSGEAANNAERLPIAPTRDPVRTAAKAEEKRQQADAMLA